MAFDNERGDREKRIERWNDPGYYYRLSGQMLDIYRGVSKIPPDISRQITEATILIDAALRAGIPINRNTPEQMSGDDLDRVARKAVFKAFVGKLEPNERPCPEASLSKLLVVTGASLRCHLDGLGMQILDQQAVRLFQSMHEHYANRR